MDVNEKIRYTGLYYLDILHSVPCGVLKSLKGLINKTFTNPGL